MWFIIALPQVTDAGVDFLVGTALFFSGPAIGLTWVVYSVVFPTVFREKRWWWLWWTVPAAGLLPVVLSVSGWGLAARVALSEPELRAFAEDVRAGRDAVEYGDSPRRVG